MLLQLLHALNSGEAYRPQKLAKELGVSIELLDSMMDELTRLGYLQRVEGTCATSCEACCQRATCVAGTRGRLWALTERGGHTRTARGEGAGRSFRTAVRRVQEANGGAHSTPPY